MKVFNPLCICIVYINITRLLLLYCCGCNYCKFKRLLCYTIINAFPIWFCRNSFFGRKHRHYGIFAPPRTRAHRHGLCTAHQNRIIQVFSEALIHLFWVFAVFHFQFQWNRIDIYIWIDRNMVKLSVKLIISSNYALFRCTCGSCFCVAHTHTHTQQYGLVRWKRSTNQFNVLITEYAQVLGYIDSLIWN